MSTLNALLSACQTEQAPLLAATRERVAQWDNWLQPLFGSSPAGEEPGYDDDFQQMREEVNKLSGADTELICRLAEKLLTTTAKDIRVATYYCWAKLHREGEQGLAEGLELLAGLLERFGLQLHPQRDRSRKAALEWLAGSRMTDSLSLYLQQNWAEMLETAGSAFSRDANHLWLDLQWYIHQALTKTGEETLAGIVAADLKVLLLRLLMGRIAEQYGKNDLAVHLFAELGERAREVSLSEWEPELSFEVQTRHLKLLTLQALKDE